MDDPESLELNADPAPVDQSTEKASKKAEIADRRRRVAANVLARIPQREIARELGVSPATINADLAIMRKEWNREAQSKLEDFIGQELASLNADEAYWRSRMDRLRMDAQRRSQMDKAPGVPADTEAILMGSLELQLRIFDRILRVGEARRKLLGMDAPVRMELARAEARHLAEEYGLDAAELMQMAEDIISGRDR